MKILMATYWRYPTTGGVSLYIGQATAQLQAAGHQIDILSRGPTWHHMCWRPGDSAGSTVLDLRLFEPTVIPIIWGSSAERLINPNAPRWVKEREGEQYLYEMGAAQICEPQQYDLIHAHDVHTARAMRRVAPQVPLILTTHGLLAYEWLAEERIEGGVSDEWRYTYIRERLGILSADVTITPSPWMRQEYTGYFGVPNDKLATLPYGFAADTFTESMKRAPTDIPPMPGIVTITCVARLVPLKGHRFLFPSLQSLQQAGVRFRCLLVGDGPEEPVLRELADTLGLHNCIEFLGARADVPAILGITDVFVLPSLQEVTPLSISEAQLAGKAVVATAISGVPDQIEDQVTGLLVPPADSPALAAALLRLCRDSELRQRLGRSAQAVVRRDRTWSGHFTQLMSVYQKIIASQQQQGDCCLNHHVTNIPVRYLLVSDEPTLDQQQVDTLATSLRRYGYDSNYPLDVAINAWGAYVVLDGRKRVAAARRLGISALPCRVVQRAPEWEAIKGWLNEVTTQPGHLYHPIDHPDFATWPLDRDCEQRLEAILAAFPPCGKRILDIGTHLGYFAFALDRRHAFVTAIDWDTSAIDVCRKLQWHYGTAVDFRAESLQSFSSTEHFDAALLLSVIHHALRRPQGIAQAEALLRKVYQLADALIFDMHQDIYSGLDLRSDTQVAEWVLATTGYTVAQPLQKDRWNRMLYLFKK